MMTLLGVLSRLIGVRDCDAGQRLKERKMGIRRFNLKGSAGGDVRYLGRGMSFAMNAANCQCMKLLPRWR